MKFHFGRESEIFLEIFEKFNEAIFAEYLSDFQLFRMELTLKLLYSVLSGSVLFCLVLQFIWEIWLVSNLRFKFNRQIRDFSSFIFLPKLMHTNHRALSIQQVNNYLIRYIMCEHLFYLNLILTSLSSVENAVWLESRCRQSPPKIFPRISIFWVDHLKI